MHARASSRSRSVLATEGSRCNALWRAAALVLMGTLVLLAGARAMAVGNVVAWGREVPGPVTPPPSVDGTEGFASAIAVGMGSWNLCSGGPHPRGMGCDHGGEPGHVCAIEADTGAVVCWGDGAVPPPPAVDGSEGAAEAIAAGSTHSCAVQAGSGAVVCWGAPGLTPPPAVDGTSGTATMVAINEGSSGGCGCGPFGADDWSYACAIQEESGAVVCWGEGAPSPPPAVDGTAGTAQAIAAAGGQSCAIQAGTGAVVCWGHDLVTPPPPAVDGTQGGATAIATGPWHSCAIQAGTGAVVCWGEHDHGQSTPPPAVDGTDGTAVAVAVGVFHSCAIESDGTVICWGSNDSGQCTPPPVVDGIQGSAEEIAVGAGYSLAIAVPEPAQPLLLVTGALVVVLWARRPRQARSARSEA